MTEQGLIPVDNPSALFLAARADDISGSAVTALMEGTRPVLVEVQALAAKAGFGTPQRVATGFDQKRLAVLLAVLERRAETRSPSSTSSSRSRRAAPEEPGADLAVAAALISSLYNRPAPQDAIFLGEVGLGGEVRPIGAIERRSPKRRGSASGRCSLVAQRDAGDRASRWSGSTISTSWCGPLPRDVGVILVAAGRGTRLGGRRRSSSSAIAGMPMVLRALRPFTAHPDVAQVALVLPAGDAEAPPAFLRGVAEPA